MNGLSIYGSTGIAVFHGKPRAYGVVVFHSKTSTHFTMGIVLLPVTSRYTISHIIELAKRQVSSCTWYLS